MHFAGQSGVLLIRLLLGWYESDHPHLLGILEILNIFSHKNNYEEVVWKQTMNDGIV